MKRAVLVYTARLLAVASLLAWVGFAHADNVMNCANQPNFACANADDTINANWTMATGKTITFSNFGAAFTASDTNPTCGAGEYKVYADLSEAKFKKCQNGSVSDLASAAVAWSDIADSTAAKTFNFDATETTTFQYPTGTGTSDMMVWQDTTGNTGTGSLGRFSTVGTSTMKPFTATAQGTANGVQMSSAGLLAKIGTGSIQADDVVCTTCVGTTDIANNAVDGTKINLTSNTTGDLMYYDGTDWVRLAVGSSTTVLHGGTTPGYSAIGSGDIGPGDIQNAVTWAEAACTADPCTLSFTPRAATTAWLKHHGIVLRRVATCTGTGSNEYTLSGTSVDFCDASQGVGSGADAVDVVAEL